jgi:hypothetical protein
MEGGESPCRPITTARPITTRPTLASRSGQRWISNRTAMDNSMQTAPGRESPSGPWTRTEVWMLVGKAAFWLGVVGLFGALHLRYLTRRLRARYS